MATGHLTVFENYLLLFSELKRRTRDDPGRIRWLWKQSKNLQKIGEDIRRLHGDLERACGVPTREEAEQVLKVSVARQQELTAQFTSLTQQRREVLGHPERLESLSLEQATPHVELIASPKNRSNHQEIVNISNGYEECYGPPLGNPSGLHCLGNTGPPGRREMALTS